MTLQEIDKKIAELEEKYKNVQGSETEVYTRIVGYHRSVANWNKGKREEYNYRKTFAVNDKQIKERLNSACGCDEPKFVPVDTNKSNVPQGKPASYKLFHKQFCRNCPPVVRFMSEVSLVGEDFDVSSDLGLELAKKYNVKSTPTVLLLDENNNVISEMHTVEELQTVLGKVDHSNIAV